MKSRAARTAVMSALAGAAAAFGQSAPDGFEVSRYAGGLDSPVAIEFAPDGRLFVAERLGKIRVVENGVLSAVLFVEETVYDNNDNGLLGLALDPDFETNGYIYAFVTVSVNEAQILRYTEARDAGEASGGATSRGQSIARNVIKAHLPTRGGFNSGGGLRVGPDRKLYFSIGDNQIESYGQDMNTLAGKICRVNLDGSTPDDNPFTTPTGTPRAVFALGFRNVFRFGFAPDGRMFALDVGSDGNGRREEINLVVAGGNYGWPQIEGTQDPATADPAFTDPIFDYHEGGSAPVGVVYYTGSNFPAEYRGNLFHLDYVLSRLYRTVLADDTAASVGESGTEGETLAVGSESPIPTTVVSHDVFVQGSNGTVDLTQGPDGSLYYCEIFSGEIKRVAYVAADSGGDGTSQPGGGSAASSDGDTPSDGAGGDASADSDDSGAATGAGAPLALVSLCGFGTPAALTMVSAALCSARCAARRSYRSRRFGGRPNPPR